MSSVPGAQAYFVNGMQLAHAFAHKAAIAAMAASCCILVIEILEKENGGLEGGFLCRRNQDSAAEDERRIGDAVDGETARHVPGLTGVAAVHVVDLVVDAERVAARVELGLPNDKRIAFWLGWRSPAGWPSEMKGWDLMERWRDAHPCFKRRVRSRSPESEMNPLASLWR